MRRCRARVTPLGKKLPVHQTRMERRGDVEVLPRMGKEGESGPERVDIIKGHIIILEFDETRRRLWRRMLPDGEEEVR